MMVAAALIEVEKLFRLFLTFFAHGVSLLFPSTIFIPGW
jgi:hypothetical protein